MTRPNFTDIPHGVQGWDAVVNDDFALIGTTPVPLALYANAGALPTASSYDKCFAVITDDGSGGGGKPAFVMSNGTTWLLIGTRAATQAASVAATLGALVTDFNALLTKLKASGLMAP